VAGSRRRNRAESTEPVTPQIDEQDTGAEAWDDEATHADDLVTETEAGPLEESDFDDEADETVTDETDDEVDAEGDDDVTDDASDQDEPEDEDTDGDSAEEKGK
jgi:hypothetical protein